MASFIDATCTKCGRKYGWCGEMKDRPKCPKCGHLEPYDPSDDKMIDEMRDFLLNKRKQPPGLSELMRGDKSHVPNPDE